jgi:hypothetical protein
VAINDVSRYFAILNLDTYRLSIDPTLFLSRCVSVDLEIDPKSARLFAFAAVRGETSVLHKGGALEPALDRLEAFCTGAAHLVGHNILRHDLPHLVANRARLVSLGRVDKRDSHGALIVIQAGICDGDQLGTRLDVGRGMGVS